MVSSNVHYRRIITIGHDDRGNAIQYIDNEDGTWLFLYEEYLVSDEFVRRHYPEFFWPVTARLPLAKPE